MDLTLNNQTLKNVFDIITMGEMLVLLTMYFGVKRPRRVLAEVGVCFALAAIAIPVIMNRLRVLDIYLLFAFLMGVSSLCAVLSLKGKWTYKLVVCLYFCVTYLQLHTAELVFWSLVLPRQFISRIGLTQLAMCLVLMVNRRLGAWHSEDTPKVYILTLLISSLASLVVCLIALPALVPHPAYNPTTLILCLGTLAMNMTAFYQGQQLMRAYREKLTLRAVADRIHADEHLVEETNILIGELRTQRHERVNQALVIRALCDAGDTAALREYVGQILPEESPEENIDCGHVIVNAVLRQKLSRCARAGVPVTVNAHLPPRLPIRDTDLCSLMANLLDNALEGTRGEAQPAVHVSAQCVKNYLRVTVRNRVSRDVLAENPSLATTKENAADHGVGVSVIRRIVEQYDGMLDFSIQDGWFVADALLKLSAAGR